MQNYRNLIAWQKAHGVALAIHRLTAGWACDNAGLAGQMRRAAISIPSNIAEGTGRLGDREFARFVQIAIGSTIDLEYQVQFSTEAGVLDATTGEGLLEKIAEVRKLLNGLVARLREGGRR